MSEQPQATFEESIQELEKIVRALEDGNTTLDESLSKYERGVHLIRTCYGQLAVAEERITQLMGLDEAGKPVFKTFAHQSSTEVMPPEGKRRSTRKAE